MKDLDETRYQKDPSEKEGFFSGDGFKKGFITGALLMVLYYGVMLILTDVRNCNDKQEKVLATAEEMWLTKVNWYACNQSICKVAMTNPDSQYLDSLDRAGVEELISVHLQCIQKEMDLYAELHKNRSSGDWIYDTWLCHMVDSENQNMAYVIHRLDDRLLSSPAVNRAITTMIHLEGRMVAQTEEFNAAVKDFTEYTRQHSLVYWILNGRKYTEFQPIEIEDGIMNLK